MSIDRAAVASFLVVALAGAPAHAIQAQHDGHRASAAQQGTGASLGTVVFPNSGAAAAQASFLRGVALLHSFEYTEAAEAFQDAEKTDSAFPLSYWFESFTNSHILWSEDDPTAARAALAKLGPTAAARLAKAKTDRERAYGAAIEAFYVDTSLGVRSRAFADSMRHLTARYPNDLEAAAFASLAIQIADPRGDNREQAIALAERVVRESPNHPGAVHYLIHATDAPAYAARGLTAARAYAKVAPESEHAQHMPSHIFLQLGLWEEAVASNEKAWKASRDWVKRRGASGADLDFHDLQWLQYMYLQQGRYALARSITDTARAVLAGVDLSSPNDVDAQYVALTLAFQYGADAWDWRAMLGVREVPMPGPSASHRAQFFALNAMYQRAIAAAVAGDTATASKAVARFRAIVDSVAPNVPTSIVVRAREIEAMIATKRGDGERAIQLLQEASAMEGKFLFVGPPSALIAHELLGDALVAAKRPAEAEVAYEQELKLTPNRSAALLGLARARAARGDSTGAAEAARRLLANWHAADADLAALPEVRRIALASTR
ncbi:MAG TPA: tetratricopeptide repeat protein [Gemmatimonadaceae bacterium]|jgi:tetratricopeptide (TPR) repeat protein